MLNNKGFDLWADGYDISVNLSEEADEYPFAGYKRVLGTIYEIIKKGNGKRILDVGFGTGVLSKKLYDEKCTIYGVDFSQKMIEIAKKRMPKAILLQQDFSEGLPYLLLKESFDFIVCTYAIHHLQEQQQIKLIRQMVDMLAPEGQVLIGDVAFATEAEMEKCRKRYADDEWDSDEIYPIAQRLKAAFPSMRFIPISFCSGVFTISG